MTPLRQRMIEDLRIGGLAQNTIDTYVSFQVYLTCERKVSSSTLNIYVSALRFLYTVTLGKDWDVKTIPYAKTPRKIPICVYLRPHACASATSTAFVC